MVAGCPKCSARYRVDADRIGADGAKLRCTKCSAVFLVRAPQPVAEEAPAPVQVEAPPAPIAETPAETPAEQPVASPADTPPEPMPEYDSTRLVLIADPDEERGKASAEAVVSWGLEAHLVQDGVEAMLAIQRLLPSAVVLDAALPKMFGFQVCEVVKRNESLNDTIVVLVGAIHHQDRYRRNPSELYGADVYIEQPDLPEGLKPVLREGGLPIEGAAPAAAPAAPEIPEPVVSPPPVEAPASPEVSLEEPVAAPPMPETPETPEIAEPPALEFEEPAASHAAPEPTPAAEPATVAAEEDPEKTEERERALRLARIAVSEMVLYQPEKFEQATRDGNLEQMLDLEIQEARALLRQRIGEEVRAETDFIMDELNRVAAERSAQG